MNWSKDRFVFGPVLGAHLEIHTRLSIEFSPEHRPYSSLSRQDLNPRTTNLALGLRSCRFKI
jgi:hypothetical protein